MIDIRSIVQNSIDDNMKAFADECTGSPSKDESESQVRVYKALMRYSNTLLENYHQSLKSELTKHGIEL